MIRMETASTVIPAGLRELIDEVGGGENGFGGTTVHTGECTLEQYVQQCCDVTDPAKLRPGLVPQTTFWALDDDGVVVGMVRLRHYLNNRLRVHGGHIGYFVRREKRGKGYGKEMLRLALMELLWPPADNWMRTTGEKVDGPQSARPSSFIQVSVRSFMR